MPGLPGAPGTLFVVATPIGNLEDISARALRVLKEVSLVAAEDTRRTAQLLGRYGIATPTISLNAHNEVGRTVGLLSRLAAGESIALVSDAGTPTVSDPGQHLIQEAIRAGVRTEPIPGPSAVLAILSVCGLSTESFAFLGFPPIRASARSGWFDSLGEEPRTVVFFESPYRIRATLEQIGYKYGNCHIVVGRELTKVHEEVFRGPLDKALAHFSEPVGEFCVAVNLVNQQIMGVRREISDADIVVSFDQIRREGTVSRRAAVQAVARRLNVTPNRVYEAIERAKNSS